MILLYSEKKPSLPKLPLAWVLMVLVLLPCFAASAGSVSQRGVATWHDPSGSGRHTASNRLWSGGELIAAHRTLPLGSKIRVVNLSNDRSVVVEIRDRGPYLQGRIIDVSRRAAKELGLLETGIAKVRLEAVDNSTTSQG